MKTKDSRGAGYKKTEVLFVGWQEHVMEGESGSPSPILFIFQYYTV